MDLLKRLDLQTLREKPLSDFTPIELASLLVQKYPNEPFIHLRTLIFNKDISPMLYNQTCIILRGAGYDTTENYVKELSIKNGFGRPSIEIRSTNE